MKRADSTMTAAELQAWLARHEHSLTTGAAALGVSRRMLGYYLDGSRTIPFTVALLCGAIDRLARKRR